METGDFTLKRYFRVKVCSEWPSSAAASGSAWIVLVGKCGKKGELLFRDLGTVGINWKAKIWINGCWWQNTKTPLKSWVGFNYSQHMHLVGWINSEQIPLGLVGQSWIWKARKSSFLENSSSRLDSRLLFSGWNDPCSALMGNLTARTEPGNAAGDGDISKSNLDSCEFSSCLTPQTGPFVILVSQGCWRDPQCRGGRGSQPQTPPCKWNFYFWPGLFHPLVMGSCLLLPHSSASWNGKITERKVLHSELHILHITYLFLLSIHIKQDFKGSTSYFF